jgi:hypothetical protein
VAGYLLKINTSPHTPLLKERGFLFVNQHYNVPSPSGEGVGDEVN